MMKENKYIMYNSKKIYDIRTIPAIVCGDPKTRTGIVLAKSFPAKVKGVTTGEPIFQALKKCPNLLQFKPSFDVYEKYSHDMKKILEKYSDMIQQFSIDEFFLEYNSLFGTPLELAETIRKDILSNLNFTVNIGISDVKVLAKMASDFEKPNKIHTLYKSEIKSKLWPLEIEDLFMLGKEAAKKLKNIGIDTIGKLAITDDEILKSILNSQGSLLKNYANGIDNSDILLTLKDDTKSIGNSKTTAFDLKAIEEIEKVLLEVIETASKRLRDKNLKAKTITINLKNSNFKSYSSSTSFLSPISSTKNIFNAAKTILKNCYRNDYIRLVGISFSNLVSDSIIQTNIFDSFDEKSLLLDKTIDQINSTSKGKNIITRASLLKE